VLDANYIGDFTLRLARLPYQVFHVIIAKLPIQSAARWPTHVHLVLIDLERDCVLKNSRNIGAILGNYVDYLLPVYQQGWLVVARISLLFRQ
jgi:hypothetical protein